MRLRNIPRLPPPEIWLLSSTRRPGVCKSEFEAGLVLSLG